MTVIQKARFTKTDSVNIEEDRQLRCVALSEDQQKKKKRKKQLALLLEEKEVPDEKLKKLVGVLEELKEEGKQVDVQICPRCKSAKVRRVDSAGDPLGHMSLTPPKFECLECGWRDRLTIYATNRRLDKKQIALIDEVYHMIKEKDELLR